MKRRGGTMKPIAQETARKKKKTASIEAALSRRSRTLPGLMPVLSLLLLALVRRYLLELSFTSAGHFGISLARRSELDEARASSP
jgi:hypothetical protein